MQLLTSDKFFVSVLNILSSTAFRVCPLQSALTFNDILSIIRKEESMFPHKGVLLRAPDKIHEAFGKY